MKDDFVPTRSGLLVPASMAKHEPNWPPRINIPSDAKTSYTGGSVAGDVSKHRMEEWSDWPKFPTKAEVQA